MSSFTDIYQILITSAPEKFSVISEIDCWRDQSELSKNNAYPTIAWSSKTYSSMFEENDAFS